MTVMQLDPGIVGTTGVPAPDVLEIPAVPASRSTDEGPHDAWLAAPPVILVVEDDEDARETLAVLLRGQGISVLQAGTGTAALRVASVVPLSAMILDVMLPDLSGYDVCRELRAAPATRSLPIVLLTALTGVVDEVSAALAGADAFIVKPASRRRLLMHLRDLI